MKKSISILLCLCMAFSLCACAQLDVIRNTELPPLPTPQAPEEPAPTAKSAAAAVQPATPAAEGKALNSAFGAELGERVIIYTKKTQEIFDDPDGKPMLIFSYVTPTVRIDARASAAETINEQLRLLDELYISGSGDDVGKNQLLENALDNYSYVHATNAELNTEFSSARTVKSLRADGSVVSFRYWTSVYNGGTGGEYKYFCINFDSQSGEKLTLDALSSRPETLKKTIADYVISLAKGTELYAKIAENDLDPDSALSAVVREGNWHFSGEGIEIFPAFGELPETEGEAYHSFTVPYSVLADVLDTRFLPVKREGSVSLEALRLEDVEDGTIESIDRIVLSQDGEELYLKADGTAYDLTLSGFYRVDQTGDGEEYFESDRYWYASSMSDCALQICAIIPNGMPNLMISYTDADYVPHRVFLSQTDTEGGVTLVDDSIRAVG